MRNKLLKCGILVSVFFFNTLFVFSQKIIKDTIQGELVNVYPFRTSVNYNNAYFMSLRNMKRTKISVNSWYKSVYGDKFSKKELRQFKKELRSRNSKKRIKATKHLRTKKFKEAVRANPYPFITARYTLDKDIIPLLNSVPDGKYVQYFDTFALILKDGKTDLVPKRISGIFNLKDNMLEGEAVWFSPAGDTLKHGYFSKGLKVGEWKLRSMRVEHNISERLARKFIATGVPPMDSVFESYHYANGLKNGRYIYYQNSNYPVTEGHYKDNKPVGEWVFRDVQTVWKKEGRERLRDNKVVTLRYTLADKDTIVKQPIIRYTLFGEMYDETDFDFFPDYSPSIPFSKLYSLAYPKEPDLELDEERFGSYDGGEEMYDEEYYDEEYYEEEYYEGKSVQYGKSQYDYNSGKYISYAKLIDSIGVKFNYTGTYEKYYPNGQLMMRYQFENGSLLAEDTIFWDNGQPYDVIVYDRDSAHFVQTVYDYAGTLYKQLVFDSIGEFKRVDFEKKRVRYVNIDGFIAEDRSEGIKYFFYDKMDTLKHELSDSLVLFRSWFKNDTSLLYSRSYHPKDRTLSYQFYAIDGTNPYRSEINFSEDFNSWLGTSEYKIGDLNLVTKGSAYLLEYYEPDSIPQVHVNFYDEYFDVTRDQQLFRKDTPFTGKINMTFNERALKIKTSSSSIDMQYPKAFQRTEKLNKEIEKFRKTGKTKHELLFSLIDASETDEDFGAAIFGNVMRDFLYPFVEYPYSDYPYYDEFEDERRRIRSRKVAKSTYPETAKVTGSFLGGKPTGLWKNYDQFGKLITTANFFNGEMHGTINHYSYAYPREKDDYYSNSYDTLPSKKTYYLNWTAEYKNGLQHGKEINYDWRGRIVGETNYVDGRKEGPAFERNSLAHTMLNYELGVLDGYVKTYLTMPGKDSTLLFELNFQEGQLQGESRSFHLNGKLAKRGFFLMGQPIDDYEAYDTLGFKYHYVKFLYSFPIEEKIYEENELSVRYLFDWRDSIYFRPNDITTSQSLDRMLAQLGIGSDYLRRPYYGRPSLIDKRGITYHMTKYYPNDTIARDGSIEKGKKIGCWKYYSYEGEMLYEVDYFDSILVVNDSVSFRSKGVLTDYDALGNKLSESFVIEKFEKYDCSHTDHYEIRQLMAIWQAHDSIGMFNGYVKNYYDNGVLMNEGQMKDGLPSGVWKYYDPYGKLNQVGEYVLGKRHGRWLGGDLSKTKYLGDICLNPNLPNLEEELRYREKLLDITITNYRMGKALNKEFYDVNLNRFGDDGEELIDEEIEFEEDFDEH
jgi:antitoxin component YwqK of YwqJK toxin-antitoxin module